MISAILPRTNMMAKLGFRDYPKEELQPQNMSDIGTTLSGPRSVLQNYFKKARPF